MAGLDFETRGINQGEGKKKKKKNDLEERRGVGEGKVSINKILA